MATTGALLGLGEAMGQQRERQEPEGDVIGCGAGADGGVGRWRRALKSEEAAAGKKRKSQPGLPPQASRFRPPRQEGTAWLAKQWSGR